MLKAETRKADCSGWKGLWRKLEDMSSTMNPYKGRGENQILKADPQAPTTCALWHAKALTHTHHPYTTVILINKLKMNSK